MCKHLACEQALCLGKKIARKGKGPKACSQASKHSFFEPRMKKAVDAIAVVAIYWLLDDKEGFIRRSTLSKMQRLQDSPQLRRASQLRAN